MNELSIKVLFVCWFCKNILFENWK